MIDTVDVITIGGLVSSAGVPRYVTGVLDARGDAALLSWFDSETPEATLVFARQRGSTWKSADIAQVKGAHTSMVIDRAGTISIAYADLGRSAVMLATSGSTSTEWTVEPVVDAVTGFFATRPVVALTPTGSVEVCVASDDGLVIASRNGEEWVVKSVDATVRSGVDLDFVIDAAGLRHVVSRDPFTQRLAYHRSDDGGTTWIQEEVPWRADGTRNGLLGDGPSLAVDASGTPFVACWTDEGIGLATRTGTDWTFELAHAGSVVMPSPSLQLTSDGLPVIAGQDGLTGVVHLIRRDGTGWTTGDVSVPTEPRGLGGTVSLVVDERDGLHIAFVDDGTGTLSVADLNRAPIIEDIHFETGVDTAFDEINLLATLVDPDGDEITLVTTPTDAPANGTVVLRTDGRCVYRPARGFRGADRFRYEVRDARGISAFGDVTVDVIVPDVLTVERRAYPTPNRPSRLLVAVTSNKFSNWTVTLQRRGSEQWNDVRTAPATNLRGLVQPLDDEWNSGPFRLELRRRSGTDPYSIARSVAFDMPPERGVEVTIDGSVGHIGVPR